MTRTPLRPLARILEARQKGENPDAIERENIRLRHEEMRDKARVRAEGRLLVLGVFFFCAFFLVGLRMTHLSGSAVEEPNNAYLGPSITAQRADITDRNGRILATNLVTNSLYAQPPVMVDRVGAAKALAAIFPDLNEDRLIEKFTGERTFIWIKRKLSPEQMQAVHDIGEPGLLFGPREMRLYPNGSVAAHVLGGASFGREDVHAAEVIGTAGVEKTFDEYLRDPANNGAPLQLSLDLTIQAAAEQVLNGGMRLMKAKGAAAVLMDVHTGEIVSLVSLPDFDPNDRPRPLTEGVASDSPLFNRAVQGVYELGSTFKIFTAAQALDARLMNRETMIDIRGPLRWGRFRISDFHDYGAQLSVSDIIVRSSNIGTARIAQQIGPARQRAFLGSLGLLEPTPVEMVEASGGRPLLPPNWSELSAMTISYGHGLSTSPMHLAAAYASLLNGGTRVMPTLLLQDGPQHGERVVSTDTSAIVRDLLRQVVVRGTASFGEVPGYAVGGKTGTADKPRENGGGYYDDKVIATFASVFPANDPKYVLIVTLDEPEVHTLGEMRRTAGWTAVPVAAEIIRRVAPLLGLRPQIEPSPASGITLTSN
ncbi:peptidoglycan D,D-transpeptidase FtsI family protein [Pseudohalocynthiibacter aestuariivivens]|jgi:cell division protein FtsI (penicillin-binding protein 3)|uniref:Peptidoglycan D,D-transpeptidase FtsI family protein n=1 Tax=Pseudohalocynthiibacter aestuariivivens TaxID=1591409 RepID=A0ABV5JA24_9RHOB|nr:MULTISPECIES: penicillin-binding protein 2 [Pseudohalocynthiibacter]MBS9716886.1 penicillin-binding protein 2 [Pseudohalocynthiibacter aestuariivivens]MCK0102021.1 penicillin-binding protein 2 [Pseudohalocynthiibacter sp. F2068]